MLTPSEITWPSHDNCATTCHPCHLIGRPPSWLTWDLRVPTLFFFQSISTLLYANASLIALQWSYAYLFSFPTQRSIVCTLVLYPYPHLLHPNADSCPSYRYPLASVPIAYVSLQPCGSILYKMFSNVIVFPQFNYNKSLYLLNIILRILSFYLAYSMRSLTLECSPTTQFITLSTDMSISDCLCPALGLSHQSC